jgi:hypothetical protein
VNVDLKFCAARGLGKATEKAHCLIRIPDYRVSNVYMMLECRRSTDGCV